MIITQTPFRMSFFGGGTDMENFFKEHGGAVLSTTFDKYCYVNVRHLPRFFDYSTELSYSKTERVTDINDIQHPAIRNAMKMLDMHEIRLTYTLYNKDFTVMDGGIVETDEYRPVQEVMEEVLAEHGHSVSECGVISAEYLQERSYRAETQRAEAMKEKLAAEKPAPEASISFYVAECAEFPVMGEFHDNLTLEQALEVYDKIPAERMNGIKSIGFSLEDGSIYSGMFDLMVGGEVQAEVVNHIQHYRESPLVQKAISDIKTLLEKRQASKELEERPNTRQSVREALKNRKKAQEQQSNQEQAKPKKAKKKGEMEL